MSKSNTPKNNKISNQQATKYNEAQYRRQKLLVSLMDLDDKCPGRDHREQPDYWLCDDFRALVPKVFP